ncbi:MAG: hypothetical protein V4655_02105 [Bdellovibrionota bacterium]
MKRPTFFISSRSHSADLLASELVLTICDQFPKTEIVGVVGNWTSKTRVMALAELDNMQDAVKALGFDEGLNPLKESLTENLPLFAVLVGYSAIHHDLAGYFKDNEIPVILYEVTPQQGLQGIDMSEVPGRIKTALSIHKSGSTFLRASKIPFQYIGTPFRDRISKVLVKISDFDFLNDKPLISLFPGGYGEVLDKMLPRFGEFAEGILKTHDCQIVVSLREERDFDSLVAKMKSTLPLTSKVKFVLGMHLELLSLSRLAITGVGAITMEAAIAGVPTIAVYDKTDVADEAGYHCLVNQSLGQPLFLEFPNSQAMPGLLQSITQLIQDSPERADMLQKLSKIQSEFQGSATDNAADIIIHEAGLRVKKTRNAPVPPA